jgi:hypothetical protein
MVRQHQTRNLEIPGSMRSLSSGRALRGPGGIARNDGIWITRETFDETRWE